MDMSFGIDTLLTVIDGIFANQLRHVIAKQLETQ